MKSFTHNGQKFVYDEEAHKIQQIYNLKKDIEILEHELNGTTGNSVMDAAPLTGTLRTFALLALEDAKRRLAALQ